MKEEIELKLAVDAKQLRRMRSHPLLRTLASGRRARRQDLQSCYFDTADRRLQAEGMALRVRSKSGKLIQTLKAPVLTGHSGLQHMQEFETETQSEQPDLTLIQDPEVSACLEAMTAENPLVPFFETRVVRYVLPVRLIESDIEVAFDEGHVIAGDRQQAISEIELELVTGAPEYLLQLALAIGEQAPFSLEPRSKAARGYMLAEQSMLPPVFASSFVIPDDISAGGAFEMIARNCLKQIHANEAAFLSGNRNPEVVHQLRVGVRRLRAAVSLFGDLIAEGVLVQLKEDLSWVQNSLGPARDWDVFRMETLAPVMHRLPSETTLADLGEAAETLCDEGYDQARECLTSHRYALLILRLQYWLMSGGWRSLLQNKDGVGYPADQAASAFAKAGLAKRARQVLKRGKARDEAVEDSLHELRISGKKLRYALEFFRDFLKKGQAKAAIGLTKELQDCLGSLNDAAVSKSLLETLATRFPEKVDTRAVGILLGWQGHRVDDDLSHLQEVWERARKGLKPLT